MPDEVSHDELDAAHDAATDEVAEEEGVEETQEEGVEAEETDEEIPEEPSAAPGENQERSQLGRKLQGVEGDLHGMKEMLQILIHNQQQNAVKPEADEEEEDDIITKKEFPKHIAKHEQNKQAQNAKYHDDLKSRILDLGRDLSDEEFDGITKIFEKDFVMETRNSKYDALINFNKAKAKFYQKKTATGNPLDKNKGKVAKNLGGGSGTKATPKTNLKKPTDKVAIQLAKDLNLSDEFVDEALNKKLPAHLGG